MSAKRCQTNPLLERVETEQQRRQNQNPLDLRRYTGINQLDQMLKILVLEGFIQSLLFKKEQPQQIKMDPVDLKIIKENVIKQQVMLKIEQAQLELAQFLQALPYDGMEAVKGQKRPRYKDNGEIYRGSRYRGVYRNRNLYQIFIMVNGRTKEYIGGFKSQLSAAKTYDIASIQMKGMNAQTNFSYTKREVIDIMRSEPLFPVYDFAKTLTLFR